MSATQSRLRSRRALTARRERLDNDPVSSEPQVVIPVNERPRARPKRDVGRVLLGAAEICLLSKDPHLAVRAAWVLLRSDGAVSDADAMRGRTIHG